MSIIKRASVVIVGVFAGAAALSGCSSGPAQGDVEACTTFERGFNTFSTAVGAYSASTPDTETEAGLQLLFAVDDLSTDISAGSQAAEDPDIARSLNAAGYGLVGITDGDPARGEQFMQASTDVVGFCSDSGVDVELDLSGFQQEGM